MSISVYIDTDILGILCIHVYVYIYLELTFLEQFWTRNKYYMLTFIIGLRITSRKKQG